MIVYWAFMGASWILIGLVSTRPHVVAPEPMRDMACVCRDVRGEPVADLLIIREREPQR